MKIILLFIIGICYGMLAAAGVFTVFVAVGLVPRFAGRTHTADKIILYEEMVIFGTLMGSVLSIFPEYLQVSKFIRLRFSGTVIWTDITGIFLQILFGVFSGMFIGCLALAIAEMLDSIPIFTRRVGLRQGIGLAILSMSVGKLCGALFYFYRQLYRVVQ
ncbi:MAG: stage V sporulation protein AB [Acetatifactor sp.]|nr:stage V sporulation protein AB [Acetatifactor sp.]